MRKPEQDEVVKETGFSLMVNHRDDKTGETVLHDPYIMRFVGDGDGNKMQVWERPKGSGNCFDKENNKIGRWVYEEKMVKGRKARIGHYEPEAKHIAYERPLTKDQLLARELSEKSVRLAEVEKELAAIKGEAAAKTAKPATATKKDSGV